MPAEGGPARLRWLTCPECGALVHVRPGEMVDVVDDDIVEREVRVVGADGKRTFRRVRMTVEHWHDLRRD